MKSKFTRKGENINVHVATKKLHFDLFIFKCGTWPVKVDSALKIML